MRFEYFLSALKKAQFIIGNSSAGIWEAPHYGGPTINIGSRQLNRANCHPIINVDFNLKKILSAVHASLKIKKKPVKMFGSGGATNEFKNILEKKKIFGSKVTKNNLRIDILNLENSHFNISKYFKFSIVF